MTSIFTSTSAAARLDAAARFLSNRSPAAPIIVVGATRGAADDFAREIARTRGATFGMHRFSVTQLAARLAAERLARAHLSPTTALGFQAIASRALFDAARAGGLSYFAPVAVTPGFPRALAATFQELALAGVRDVDLGALPDGGRDLAVLLDEFDAQLRAASAADRAAFFAAASESARTSHSELEGASLVLLDVEVANGAERDFVSSLIAGAVDTCATVSAGDARTLGALGTFGDVIDLDTDNPVGIDRVRRFLFADQPPPAAEELADVELFSAPSEGREAVEIARRVVREARRGVPFDCMAIVLRSPYQYAGLLEHALRRAGVAAYFDRGTRRPHPAGRAFLAILACAAERVSARRFAEYLSLGQVPCDAGTDRLGHPASSDEVFGVIAERARALEGPRDEEEGASSQRPVAQPWRWERLLIDSRVVGGVERWSRRLNGLIQECELQRRDLQRSEPDSPRLAQLGRKIEDLAALGAFALPIVRTLAAWPVTALWGGWLELFEEMAPRVLERPDRVLRVLADLRPMSAIGPIALDEAAQVLSDRLSTIESEPPLRRYGRVFVSGAAGVRGRAFDVVFVPGLAERLFPQRPREDPLLLDNARAVLRRGLVTQPDRAQDEKLQLQLAVGAARSRLYLSFPTTELGEGRPRVPSLYALELWRAVTGSVPGSDELQQKAARASGATLAWPAPPDPRDAVDDLEHDLATLRRLMVEPAHRVRGRAQYMLRLNDCVQRSVRERYMRARRTWSHWDGITRATDRTAPALAAHRLNARAYSVSALQRYAVCPYQFLLGSIYRLRPAEGLDALQRLDPLTKGSLFHAIQTAFYRQLLASAGLPLTESGHDAASEILDRAIDQVAAEYHERLAPAVERVWSDELDAIRRDLRLWVDDLVHAGGEWAPRWFEWSFGLRDAGRDPESVPDPVVIGSGYALRGSIDLVEEGVGTGDLRVTDHKTGRYRGKDRMVVDGGRTLQPVLYGLVLEAATGRRVAEGRLYYATTEGGFRVAPIALTPETRRAGIEVLEIIDRAIETGVLMPAPVENACTWCDFRQVCGSGAERRITRYKAVNALTDLVELRRKP